MNSFLLKIIKLRLNDSELIVFSGFCSKVTVAEVADPGNDIKLVVDLGIKSRGYNLNLLIKKNISLLSKLWHVTS